MDMQHLLDEFSKALAAEIAEIEKQGRNQTYDLLSGHRDASNYLANARNAPTRRRHGCPSPPVKA